LNPECFEYPKSVDQNLALKGFEYCNEITKKSESNLYFTSKLIKNKSRYFAFVTLYAVMRIVDDLVDNTKSAGIKKLDEKSLRLQVNLWHKRILSAHSGTPYQFEEKKSTDKVEIDHAVTTIFANFPMPINLWNDFFEAMVFDIKHERFENFEQFVAYSKGASVAPTTIYIYLLAAQKDGSNKFIMREESFLECGYNLGIFAYIAHILRDVKKDMLAGENGLFYITNLDLHTHNLDDIKITEMTNNSSACRNWESLVQTLVDRAKGYEEEGTKLANKIFPTMDKECAWILDMIITIYRTLLKIINQHPQKLITSRIDVSYLQKMLIMLKLLKKHDMKIYQLTPLLIKL